MKSIDDQLELAKKAQAQIDNYTQEQVDEMCLAIGWEATKKQVSQNTQNLLVLFVPFYQLQTQPQHVAAKQSAY